MSEIDWSTAPEGATHWAPSNDSFNECFMKLQNGIWYTEHGSLNEEIEWVEDDTEDNPSRYIARPVQRSEGYRPRPGTVYECQLRGYGEWQIVKILCEYQASPDSKVMLWATNGEGGEHCFTIHPHANFRPINTPEQIAAEERFDRVHAIEGIILRGQELALTITQIAAAIDDAGYRKAEGGAE